MISNKDQFWDWFISNNSNSFKLYKFEEGYTWNCLNSKGEGEESDMWFDSPYDALVDFFSNLICCEVVEK